MAAGRRARRREAALAHDDLALTAALGVEHVGFGAPGTAPGPQAIVERDVYEVDAARLEYVREPARRGTSVTAVGGERVRADRRRERCARSAPWRRIAALVRRRPPCAA